MTNKPLTAEDLVIGKEYRAISKSVGDIPFEKMMEVLDNGKVYYKGCRGGNHIFVGNISEVYNDPFGFYLLPSDVIPYEEEKVKPDADIDALKQKAFAYIKELDSNDCIWDLNDDAIADALVNFCLANQIK